MLVLVLGASSALEAAETPAPGRAGRPTATGARAVKCVAPIVTRVVNTGPWREGAPWGKVLRSRCGVAPTQATWLTAAPA